MKIRNILSLILSVLLFVLVISGTLLQAGAATTVPLVLKAEKYDVSTGTYQEVREVNPGEEVKLSLVANGTAANVAGLRVQIGYDPDAFTYRINSATSMLVDTNGQATFSQKADHGTIIAMWDTTTKDMSVTGPIFSFGFTARDTAASLNGVFTLTVLEFWGTDGNEVPSTTTGVSVQIGSPALSSTILAVFNALETIAYPDSWEDIVAADKTFAGMSAAEIRCLVQNYPAQYAWYNTAKNRYFALEEQANSDAILAAVQSFKNKHAEVLAKTVDTVTLQDAAIVTAACDEFAALSSLVKSHFDKATTVLLDALNNQLKKLQKEADANAEAAVEYADFLANYDIILHIEPSVFAEGFETLGPQVEEALLAYGFMSEKAQQMAAAEHAILNSLYAQLQELIAEDEEEQALLKQVADFVNRWKYVVSLTTTTVQVSDKAAVEMMLEDIAAQSPELQSRLALRKTLGERLLAAITALEENGAEDTAPEIVETIVEVEKVVEVPTENATGEDAQTSENTGGYVVSGMPMIILILLAMLVISILLLIYPAIKAFALYKEQTATQAE